MEKAQFLEFFNENFVFVIFLILILLVIGFDN